jgi:hypothetical protein
MSDTRNGTELTIKLLNIYIEINNEEYEEYN